MPRPFVWLDDFYFYIVLLLAIYNVGHSVLIITDSLKYRLNIRSIYELV